MSYVEIEGREWWKVLRDYKRLRKKVRFTKAEREEVFAKTGGKCHWCKVALERGGDDGNRNPSWFTIDHVVSLRYGGKHQMDNFVPACRSCNCRKGAA